MEDIEENVNNRDIEPMNIASDAPTSNSATVLLQQQPQQVPPSSDKWFAQEEIFRVINEQPLSTTTTVPSSYKSYDIPLSATPSAWTLPSSAPTELTFRTMTFKEFPPTIRKIMQAAKNPIWRVTATLVAVQHSPIPWRNVVQVAYEVKIKYALNLTLAYKHAQDKTEFAGSVEFARCLWQNTTQKMFHNDSIIIPIHGNKSDDDQNDINAVVSDNMRDEDDDDDDDNNEEEEIVNKIKVNVTSTSSETSSTTTTTTTIVVPFSQPTRISTPLLPYQIQALQWMCKIEQECNQPHPFSQDLFLQVDKGKSIAVTNRDTLVLPQAAPQASLKTRGGVYADPPKTGKRVTMLALIMARPAAAIPEGTTLTKTTKFVPSRATLIVTDNMRFASWKSLIAQHCSPAPNVIYIQSRVALRNVTYRQLMDADVVFFSRQLANTNPDTNDTREQKSYDQLIQTAREALLESSVAPVLLPLVDWHRVVFDACQAHLTTRQHWFHGFTDALQCKTMWMVASDSRMDNPETCRKTMTLLHTIITMYNRNGEVVECSNMYEIPHDLQARPMYLARINFAEKFFWFNSGVGEAKMGPPPTTPVILVPQPPSQLENVVANIYAMLPNNKTTQQVFKYHLQTNAELRSLMGPDTVLPTSYTYGTPYQDWDATLKYWRDRAEASRVAVQEHLAIIQLTTDIIACNRALEKWIINLVEHQDKQQASDRMHHDIRFLRMAGPLFYNEKLSEQECSVCRIDDHDEWIVLPCGHMVCSECYPNLPASYKSRCCECRVEYNPQTELTTLKAKLAPMEHAVLKYGSKMATLMDYVKTNIMLQSSGQLVLHCNHAHLAELMQSTFVANGVSCELLPATPETRAVCLQRFHQNKTRVLIQEAHPLVGLESVETTHVMIIQIASSTNLVPPPQVSTILSHIRCKDDNKTVTIISFN
jgi:hypothetical protein